MQLYLFAQPKIEAPKVRFYKDLSIHEKINVKLNCQLPHVHLLNARKGYCKTSPICRDDHPEGINPFQPCIDLWERGLVPSFDGKTWRLHSGSEAKVVYEL